MKGSRGGVPLVFHYSRCYCRPSMEADKSMTNHYCFNIDALYAIHKLG